MSLLGKRGRRFLAPLSTQKYNSQIFNLGRMGPNKKRKEHQSLSLECQMGPGGGAEGTDIPGMVTASTPVPCTEAGRTGTCH